MQSHLSAEPLPDPLRPRLIRGLQTLGIEADTECLDRLLRYLDLLEQWNAVYNLSAVRDRGDMLVRHLFDSVAVAPRLRVGALADLGSGAGLPGIPLAILDDTRNVMLVESNGKKARFLRHASRELELTQVRVCEVRIEERSSTSPANLIARAVAPLARLVEMAQPWFGANTLFYAMKGPGVDAEIAALPAGIEVLSRHRLDVPDLDAERQLVVLKRATAAPDR